MSKFVLEIELDDVTSCNGCPLLICHNILEKNTWAECRALIGNIDIQCFDAIRHPNCPLKPIPTTTQPEHIEVKNCATCKHTPIIYTPVCGNCHNTLKNNWEPKE